MPPICFQFVDSPEDILLQRHKPLLRMHTLLVHIHTRLSSNLPGSSSSSSNGNVQEKKKSVQIVQGNTYEFSYTAYILSDKFAAEK